MMQSETKDQVQSNPAFHEKNENVAVMELLDHWNYFKTTVEVLAKRYNVSIIVSDAFCRNLRKNFNFELSKYNFISLQNIDFAKIYAFLSENKISKLFVNTIQGYEFTYAFSRFNPPVPFFFTIHSFDLWLGQRPLFSAVGNNNLFTQINNVYVHCCREIISRAAGIISTDKSVRDSASELILGKNIYYMPPSVKTELLSVDNLNGDKENLVFTIPASVDGGRRNYKEALESFKELAREYDTIKFVLLGRPVGDYGKQILEECKTINTQFNRDVIECFEGYIHQDIFEDRLRNSDYFIVPVNNLHIFGKYKASGAIHDAMIYGRPILIPQDMYFSDAYWKEFGAGFITYENLTEKIAEVISMPKEQKMAYKKAALNNANYFYTDKIVDKICDQFTI